MSIFGPPKGGWPTDVVVPSERLAKVTARLQGRIISVDTEWRYPPLIPAYAGKLYRAVLEQMSRHK